MSESLPWTLLKALWEPQFLQSTGNLCKGTWKAIIILEFATDAKIIINAIRKDYTANTKHNTIHALAEAAGTWAALVPCGTLGAALGSKISETGALVGGFLGAIVGSYHGGEVALIIAKAIWPAPEDEKPKLKEPMRVSLSLMGQNGQVEESAVGSASMDDVLAGIQATLEHFSPENIAARKAEAEKAVL